MSVILGGLHVLTNDNFAVNPYPFLNRAKADKTQFWLSICRSIQMVIMYRRVTGKSDHMGRLGEPNRYAVSKFGMPVQLSTQRER